jgi:hypothetical protein
MPGSSLTDRKVAPSTASPTASSLHLAPAAAIQWASLRRLFFHVLTFLLFHFSSLLHLDYSLCGLEWLMARRYIIIGGISMLHQGVDARQILREDGPDLSCTRQMSPTLQRSRHIRHRWCLLEERQQRKPHQQRQPPRLLEWCQLLKQGVFTNRLFPVQAKPKADDAHCTQTQIRMPLNGLERVKRAFRFSHSLSPRGLLVSLPHMPKKPPRSCPHLCSYLPFSWRTALL